MGATCMVPPECHDPSCMQQLGWQALLQCGPHLMQLQAIPAVACMMGHSVCWLPQLPFSQLMHMTFVDVPQAQNASPEEACVRGVLWPASRSQQAMTRTGWHVARQPQCPQQHL